MNDLADYVARINAARVYDVARVTSLDRARRLSDKLGVEVLLKREDTQDIHSFKIRGAYNKMSRLPKDVLAKGVLAASAGNHAQGVALSAKKLKTKAVIVMPETAPKLKIDEVRSYGADIVLHGATFSDAADEAKRIVKEKGLTFIPPYDDPDVIAGQGTVAKEILEQRPDVDSIFVPIGGGGFAAGVSAYVKGVKPSVKVYGVEPDDSDCMARSIQEGHPVSLEHPGLFVDGVCVKRPGDETFRICRECLDGIIRVKMSEICSAIQDLFEATRSVCEPAGALALAALKKTVKKGDTAVAIISGANMNFASLSFIAGEAIFARLREEILRNGKVDINEAQQLLARLKLFLEPAPDVVALGRAVESALADGVITEEESNQIAKALDVALDWHMMTISDHDIMG